MKRIQTKLFILIASVALIGGCQKGQLDKNPNLADENSAITPSYILNRLTYELYQGGGVLDARSGYVFEGPWDQVMRWNQYTVSNFSYYRGTNAYGWSNTATAYDVLKYAIKMEERSLIQYGTSYNVYGALAKFFRAYNFVWLTQRVGDIPMTEAGDATNLTPAYDKQHDVYKNVLDLLDSANTAIATAIAPNTATNNANVVVDGDIYGLTYAQWQKVINAYKLRVLISLSKRADDNADLDIKAQFANIINNPTKYPIFTSNSDNLAFKYNSINQYPRTPSDGYNIYENIGATYLNITTTTEDPRTFLVATPAPAQLAAPNNKLISDFTAYVGADVTKTLSELNSAAVAGSPAGAAGAYSFESYKRYYASKTGPENYIILGYPEMCFNIAEAVNLGWVSGQSAETWYTAGIKGSLNFYGITDGQTMTIGDLKGNTLGTVTANVTQFLTNVAYAGDNASGRQQILQQKYVAMFQNSGWEAYYNWRRTGLPVFAEGGAGIGTASNKIPRRWLYPTDETTYNTQHANDAIKTQFGTDDVTADMWLTK